MAGVIEGTADGVALNRDEFIALPLAFRRRLLKKAVDLAGGASSELSRVQIDEAVRFLETVADREDAVELPLGMTIVREYDTVPAPVPGGNGRALTALLRSPVKPRFPNWASRWRARSAPCVPHNRPAQTSRKKRVQKIIYGRHVRL